MEALENAVEYDIKNPILRGIVDEQYSRYSDMGGTKENLDVVCYGDNWDRHGKYNKYS